MNSAPIHLLDLVQESLKGNDGNLIGKVEVFQCTNGTNVLDYNNSCSCSKISTTDSSLMGVFSVLTEVL